MIFVAANSSSSANSQWRGGVEIGCSCSSFRRDDPVALVFFNTDEEILDVARDVLKREGKGLSDEALTELDDEVMGCLCDSTSTFGDYVDIILKHVQPDGVSQGMS